MMHTSHLTKTPMVGDYFPEFEKQAVVFEHGESKIKELNEQIFKGKWMVMFWWPKDFSVLCPTELVAFQKAFEDFEDRETLILGASTDSEYVHLAWKNHTEELNNIQFPMLADTSKSLAEKLGILEPKEKVAFRTTYIVDNSGLIRWMNIGDFKVGRNIVEILRVLDALQTESFCPCNWKKGDAFM